MMKLHRREIDSAAPIVVGFSEKGRFYIANEVDEAIDRTEKEAAQAADKLLAANHEIAEFESDRDALIGRIDNLEEGMRSREGAIRNLIKERDEIASINEELSEDTVTLEAKECACEELIKVTASVVDYLKQIGRDDGAGGARERCIFDAALKVVLAPPPEGKEPLNHEEAINFVVTLYDAVHGAKDGAAEVYMLGQEINNLKTLLEGRDEVVETLEATKAKLEEQVAAFEVGAFEVALEDKEGEPVGAGWKNPQILVDALEGQRNFYADTTDPHAIADEALRKYQESGEVSRRMTEQEYDAELTKLTAQRDALEDGLEGVVDELHMDADELRDKAADVLGEHGTETRVSEGALDDKANETLVPCCASCAHSAVDLMGGLCQRCQARIDRENDAHDA